MTQPVETLPLVDTLPPGEYYDDRETEADLIEDIRRGYLTVVASVPMENFLALMKSRLEGKPPAWVDWADLRFHLQGVVGDFLDMLSLDDLAIPRGADLVRTSGNDEAPDPRALRLASEAIGEDDDDAEPV